MLVKVGDALRGVQRLGVDTSPLIYYIERHPDFHAVCDDIFQAASNDSVTLSISALAYTETLNKPLQTGDRKLAGTYRRLLMRSKGVQMHVVSQAVAEKAALLRVRYRIKTPDALHVATAIVHQCDAFLTNDAGLTRVQEMRVLLVSDLET